MHQLTTKSDKSIPAVCDVCRLWCLLPCHTLVWLNLYLSTLGWRWTASTAMSCCLSRCVQQLNMPQNVVYSQNNMLLTAKVVIFCVLWFPKVKVDALDRWGGKWNHLSMTHTLTAYYANNYCNRTHIVTVIVENVVTCFFGTQCTWAYSCKQWPSWHKFYRWRRRSEPLSNMQWRNVTLSEIRFD